MNKLLKAGLIAATLFAGALTATVAAAQDTIRFAVTDIDGMEALQTEMGPFKDAFEAASGLRSNSLPCRAAPSRLKPWPPTKLTLC